MLWRWLWDFCPAMSLMPRASRLAPRPSPMISCRPQPLRLWLLPFEVFQEIVFPLLKKEEACSQLADNCNVSPLIRIQTAVAQVISFSERLSDTLSRRHGTCLLCSSNWCGPRNIQILRRLFPIYPTRKALWRRLWKLFSTA